MPKKKPKPTKHEVLNKVMATMFNAVTDDDILKHTGREFKRGNDAVTEGEMQSYSAEAKGVLATRLWAELYNSIRVEANRKMYQNSLTFDDMVFGKEMLYSIEMVKRKLENLAGLYK